MLKQRVITAVVLAPIVVGGLFLLPPTGFAVFTGALLAIAGWEWANLSGFEGGLQRWAFALVLIALMVLFQALPVVPLLGALAVFWLLVAALVAAYPGGRGFWHPRPARLTLGILALVGAWLALNHLRSGELVLGHTGNNLLLILYTFLVVWGADIGAYFAGRAFGRRKLAPAVSPGKTWAGVWGGLAVVAALALVVAWRLDLASIAVVQFVLASLLTALASVLGDLFESMLKRHRGIKDSSQLLPGHGGILDRIDSLVVAIPVLASCFTLLGWLTPVQ
ncbi:phosphatidate cytidylyltransferase [Vreelandella utahensis]|uniref:phosphatidate cytidylyltransferase n=1 Tax=Vreelandella halophila TaxID=86177 RepID=UPI00098751F2|nr:phosphatidate cytidylyltransferase [Halomonas utahensis]